MEGMSKGSGPIMIPFMVMIMFFGMYIYTSSHYAIMEAESQISEQEKTSFNQQWNIYEGAQGGNNIKALLQKIIGNCNTNKNEEERLVDVACSRATEDDEKTEIIISSDNVDESIQELQTLRNKIMARHTYYVQIEYDSKTSLVNRIIIKYEIDDEIDN